MFDPHVALWIRRLLQEGLSRCKVAQITGVSRDWISLIASGIRPDDAVPHEPPERACRGPDRPAGCRPTWDALVRRLCKVCRACWAFTPFIRRPLGVGPVDGFQHPLRQPRNNKHGQGRPAPRWPDRGLSGHSSAAPF